MEKTQLERLRMAIEGSYKEGFDLDWELRGDEVFIRSDSIRGVWCYDRDGIECRIYRSVKEEFPNLKVMWF